jgi:hypothetical protein
MAKIVNLFPVPKTEGTFGVEIEVEGEKLPMADDFYWSSHDDASLRGEFPSQRHEYVFRKPLPFNLVEPALDVLTERFTRNRSKLNFSFRTSVHVHYNVQQFDEVHLLNLIYLYTLLEEPLINFCGEGRKANRFCLRIADAEGIIDLYTNLFAHGVALLQDFREDHVRYSSLNLACVRKYGSVEFRSMRGTADKEVLMTWISAIGRIGEFAQCKGITPFRIREMFKNSTPAVFLENILGKALAEKFKYPEMENDMNMSHSLSIDLPFFFARSPYVKKQEKVKRMGAIEQKIPDDVEGGLDERIRQLRREMERHHPIRPNPEIFFRAGAEAMINNPIEVVVNEDHPV